jgi:lipoprotein-releasing system permease protein
VFVVIAATYLLFMLFLGMLRKVSSSVPLMIADRYLFTWKNRLSINAISFISVIGISFATTALILILSVFNGFQSLIEGLYTSWDADVRVVAARGKSFEDSPELRALLTANPQVEAIAPCIENKAMLTYYDKHYMVTLKGLDSTMLKVRRLDTLVYEGDFSYDRTEGYATGVLGGSVAYYLNAQLNDRVHPIKIWAARETPGTALEKDLEDAVSTQYLFPSGYFEAMEYDVKYVLVSLDMMDSLYGFGNQVTSFEIRIKDFGKADQVKAELQTALDQYQSSGGTAKGFRVETWYDQHKTLFDVMKNEKLVAYLILTLMLLIAAVNIVGSLSMIVLEKTSDIAVLQSMGATKGMIRRTFALEGMMVGLIGGFSGMASAGLLTLGQLHIGLFRINGGETFGQFEFFPIEPALGDYLAIFLTVLMISVLASFYPSWKSAQGNLVQALRR